MNYSTNSSVKLFGLKKFNLAAIAIGGLVLSGCNSGSSSNGQPNTTANNNAQTQNFGATALPLCSNYPTWGSDTVYANPKTKVVYNNNIYSNNWWTQNNNPSTNSGGAGSGQPWTLVSACSGGVTPTPTPTPTPTVSPTVTPTPIPTVSPTPSPTVSPNPNDCSKYPTWSASVAYSNANTKVVYNNVIYYNNWWTQNNNPATNSGAPGSGQPWTVVGTCGVTPTPTPTPTVSPTPSPSPTPTIIPIPTPTPTVSPTPSPKPTVSPTPTPTVSPTPSPTPTVNPTPTPTPTVSPTPIPTPTPTVNPVLPAGFVFSPYKDVGINANWNTLVISTLVGGSKSVESVVNVLNKTTTLTWAFATGKCGAENWAGMDATAFAAANVNQFVKANKNYIVSTGGAAGTFTCTTNKGMDTFINRYMSNNLVGFDFDIEASQSTADINSLITQIAYAQSKYPKLRFSFTLATSADSSGGYGNLNSVGMSVVNAALAAKLKFYVNLMVMDYGSATQYNCYVSNGKCDMAQSAIQAVTNLEHSFPQIAPAYIEVTPMIGDNDVQDEIFSMADATTLAKYVIANGLGGYHFWSLDRDTPCAAGTKYVSNTCNNAANATVLGYTNLLSNAFD